MPNWMMRGCTGHGRDPAELTGSEVASGIAPVEVIREVERLEREARGSRVAAKP